MPGPRLPTGQLAVLCCASVKVPARSITRAGSFGMLLLMLSAVCVHLSEVMRINIGYFRASFHAPELSVCVCVSQEWSGLEGIGEKGSRERMFS